MARSDNVYVVQSHDRGDLLAAFTVKHELCTWLYRRYDKNVTVTRVEDSPVGGDSSKVTEMELSALIEQGYRQAHTQWERSLPEYRGEEPQLNRREDQSSSLSISRTCAPVCRCVLTRLTYGR